MVYVSVISMKDYTLRDAVTYALRPDGACRILPAASSALLTAAAISQALLSVAARCGDILGAPARCCGDAEHLVLEFLLDL